MLMSGSARPNPATTPSAVSAKTTISGRTMSFMSRASASSSSPVIGTSPQFASQARL